MGSLLDSVRTVDILIVLLSIGCIIFNLFKLSFITLNENQVLYFFSTGAQVVAALFGITLAGYIFFNDRLDKEVQDDDSLYDAVEGLKKDYYKMIIKMGIICVLSIALCLLNIALYSDLGSLIKIYDYLINQASTLLLCEIFYIVIFIIKVTDPNKILKISSEMKSKIGDTFDTTGDFGEFLKNYNQLEKKILTIADMIISGNDKVALNNRRDYRPQIFQALNILISKEIMDKVLTEEIDSMRQYRNYVVHSIEPTVDGKTCQRIIELNNKVGELINKYIYEHPELDLSFYQTMINI